MSDYTPTTSEVREGYARYSKLNDDESLGGAKDQFNSWLTSYRADLLEQVALALKAHAELEKKYGDKSYVLGFQDAAEMAMKGGSDE